MHHKLMIILFCSLPGLLGAEAAWSQGGGETAAEKRSLPEGIAGKLRAAMQKLEAD
jgi:hypothetical protein